VNQIENGAESQMEGSEQTDINAPTAYCVMLTVTAVEVTVVPPVPGAEAVALTVIGADGESVPIAKA
jgi:hypothetical protein